MLLGLPEIRPKARQSKTEEGGTVFRRAVGGGWLMSCEINTDICGTNITRGGLMYVGEVM